MGNPFYPVSLLGFKGNWTSSGETFLKATLSHPIEVFNAFFGEYKLWVISVFVTPAYIIFKYIKRQKKQLSLGIEKIFIIGLINLLLFTQFPTWSDQSWILVSTFRYSYPVFIPLMLGVFLLASKYKKMELLGYFVIANMIFVTTFAYYPKLVIFYFPIGLFLLYLIDKYSYKFKD